MSRKGVFEVVSPFTPMGDQPTAIDQLTGGIQVGQALVVCLLGATGTGKTFTMAHVIAGAGTHAHHQPQQDAGCAVVRGDA